MSKASKRILGLNITAILGLVVFFALTCSQDGGKVEQDVFAESLAALTEAPSGEAGLPENAWGRKVQAYLEQDTRRVHRHPETGALLMNRGGMRWLVKDGAISVVSGDVEVDEADLVIGGRGTKGKWGFSYRYVGLSSPGGGLEAASTLAAAEAEENRMLIDHGGSVVEEHENLPEGIEQRFVVSSAAPGDLVLHGVYSGHRVESRLDADGVVFSAAGTDVVMATNPRAFDTYGAELPCRFVLGDGTLDIEVLGAADYPVTVDPVWFSVGDDQIQAGFGHSVASAGDVNDDGFDDVLVGAPYYDTANSDAGKIYLFYGSAGGLGSEPVWTSSGDNVTSANFGFSACKTFHICIVGYCHTDIVVGAPGNGSSGFVGKVYLFHGATGGIPGSYSWYKAGTQANQRFGYSVSSGGSTTNYFGGWDIVIGSPGYDIGASTDVGRVDVYRYTGTFLWSSSGPSQAGARFGHSVALIRKLNGDSYADVVVGAPGYDAGRGAVYVYSSPNWQAYGTQAGAGFGAAVASAGYVNDDIYEDLIVGAPNQDGGYMNSGKAFLYQWTVSGPPTGPSAWNPNIQEAANAYFGTSVAGAGDVNDDGFADVIVGAPKMLYPLGSGGKAYLFLGGTGGLAGSPAWYSSGGSTYDRNFGQSVSSAGDVNNDGYDDVVVGDPGYGFVIYIPPYFIIVTSGAANLFLGADAPSGLCDPLGVACDDHDACTENDACASNGVCSGTSISCDDGNFCTDDSCNPATGCVFTNNNASCNDGDACTQPDTCSGGVCAGNAITCNDGNFCTTDSCNSQTGCVFTNNNVPCDDANACTVGDFCAGGACNPGPNQLDCNDLNVCTNDFCNTASGCYHVNNTLSCEEVNLCTLGDVCVGGVCVLGEPIDCDDGNACLDDFCSAIMGCGHEPNLAVYCDDGSACTFGDHCITNGYCVGTAFGCDDGNPCTNDSCDPQGRCQYAYNAAACDDDDPCTENAVCTGGACVGTSWDDACGVRPNLPTRSDPSQASDLFKDSQFIYTGAKPVQTDVGLNVIQDWRAAVVRGRVKDRDGFPLHGVTVKVLDHPEYGQTVALGGTFNLVVNGGGLLTLVYEKANYISVQRQVQVPWRDYVWADDVVMVGRDPVTKLVQTGPNVIVWQFARGSLVGDADGTRTATAIFPPPSVASGQVIKDDGTPVPLEEFPDPETPPSYITVTFTEFTVGDSGPEAMPAELPPNTAYTYAVEVGVEGAKKVTFAGPVFFYLENFLGLPVGTPMPMGSYDRESGVWKASALGNGRVIKILSEELLDGVPHAVLDTDGIGGADNELGLDDAERRLLAELYNPVVTLWRIPVDHFTDPWDANLGYSPPGGAEPPGGEPEGGGSDDSDRNCQEEGSSYIQCQSQILNEEIPITGTGFSLHYSSDRVPGYKEFSKLKIPLHGGTLPQDTKSVEVEVSLAGHTWKDSFPAGAAPEWYPTTDWECTDASGRPLQGRQPITVRRGYTYPGNYQQTDRFGENGNGTKITTNATREDVTLWTEWKGAICNWDAKSAYGLGGWSLSVHHAYDPVGRMLFLGDGRRRSAEAVGDVGDTLVGNSERCSYGPCGDGGLAVDARLNSPAKVAVGPDGSVYIADEQNSRIRRVFPDGTIDSVPIPPPEDIWVPTGVAFGPDGKLYIADKGNDRIVRLDPDAQTIVVELVAGVYGEACDDSPLLHDYPRCGDGGPATEAWLDWLHGISIGPDGAVYIVEYSLDRIRKIGTDGIITNVAGIVDDNDCGLPGSQCYYEDFIPASLNIRATDVNLRSPWGIFAASNGDLYISDSSNDRVLLVTPDGLVRTFAGTGDYCNDPDCGDGGPAISALLNNPTEVAAGPDGSIYIADSSNTTVRRVGPDGIITTIAGMADEWCDDVADPTCGDGNLGPNLRFKQLDGICVGPDGTIYVSDDFNHRIRRLAPPLQGYSSHGDIAIASADGLELYVFTANGKHQRTLDAVTGGIRYEFDYYDPSQVGACYSSAGNVVGLLCRVRDGDGNPTVINRNGDGNPVSIVGPHGQTTVITLDGNGYLDQVYPSAAPAEKFNADHDGQGMLVNFKNPREYSSSYEYNDKGLLFRAVDTLGGYKRLERTELSNGYEVALTTKLGRQTKYRTERLGDGIRLTNTFPSGERTWADYLNNGTIEITYPDNTRVNVTQAPDPRWGMQAPLEIQNTTTPIGAKVLSVQEESTVALSNSNNPMSLTTLADTVVVNGKQYDYLFDATVTPKKWTINAPIDNPDPLVKRRATMEVDAQGRVTRHQLGEEGVLLPMSFAYDAQGRLTTITWGDRVYTLQYYPSGSGEKTGYLKTVTDPLAHTVTLDYNSAGRVNQLTLPGSRVIDLGSDANGNLTSVTPPGKTAHGFTYNGADLMTSYLPPLLTPVTEVSTTYDYNADRQLDLVTVPDQAAGPVTIDPAYHATKGRLETIALPDGRTVTVGYSDGDPPGEGNTGRVNQINLSPDDVNLSYTYDGVLMLLEAWTGQVVGAVVHDYNNDFQENFLQISGSAYYIVDYLYGNDGLLDTVRMPGVPVQLDVQRDLNTGFISGTTLSDVATGQTYNQFGELATFTAYRGGSPIYDVEYDALIERQRDKLGRIVYKTETIQGATTVYQYTYDAAGRLTDVGKNGAPYSHYEYDPNGNRTYYKNYEINEEVPTAGIEHDPQDRLKRYGSATYTYTYNGELESKTVGTDTTFYEYDVLGNLRSVILHAGTPSEEEIEYVIDGRNRRIGKKVGGNFVQKFLYKDQLEPIAELNGAGSVMSFFVYGTRINVPDYMVKNGTIYRIISDHLGSVRLVVDVSTGATVQRIDYDEFGKATLVTGTWDFQPFGFAGGLYDPDTGLTRFGARDYDPLVGRWTVKDPISFSSNDFNLYVYVMNDPINWIDPFGLIPGMPYPTQHAAAWDALADVSSFSQELGVELGGLIYQNPDGTFSYTPPISGDEEGIDPGGARPMVPCNSNIASDYHTHLPWSDQVISGKDISGVNKLNRTYPDYGTYVSNTEGHMMYYSSNTGPMSIGSFNVPYGIPLFVY